MTEKQPFKFILLNAAYNFIVLAIAILAAMLVKIVLNLILPIDLQPAQGGDYSRNFHLVFPIHGIVSALAFFAVCYFGGKKVGFNTGFRYRTEMSTVSFVISAVLAMIVYYFLFIYMMEWYHNLPTWYLSGALAALTGIIDAGNIYNNVSEGFAEIDNLYFHYFGLHILLEILFIVGAAVVMRIARRHGEQSAVKVHEAQLAELEAEKERLANAKTLK
ncbi:MAG: hypothetical protein IJD82_00500 [Clostridia bacterium]|nr:hypothetical protein [Clostridia bacterium]